MLQILCINRADALNPESFQLPGVFFALSASKVTTNIAIDLIAPKSDSIVSCGRDFVFEP